MKKYISILLVLTVALSCFSFISASAAIYEKPDNYSEMAGLLTALNITDETLVNEQRNITRAEFTKLVVNASGLSQFVSENVSYPPFTDVDINNEFAPYIELAKSKKLALGYSDGSFKPNDTITVMEAVVYLIRLLGYSDIAEDKGGYPSGYQSIAYSVDLMTSVNIPLSSNLTVDCAVNLIFNALNTNVLAMSDITNDSYSIEAGKPLMYKSFRLVKEKGILDGVDLTSLVGPNDIKPYHIKVNDTLIDVDMVSANDLLGYNVNAYYQETENGNVLKYICEASRKNNVSVIKISDIYNISNYTITEIDKNGKDRIYRYMRGASIIYNGVTTSELFNLSILKDSSGNYLQGEVKLLDNNNDKTYDVIFINAYEEYIVGKIDKSTNTLFDANDMGKNIILDTKTDDPYTIIYNANGEEIALNKVKANSSILVYKSKSDAYQGYIKAYVSDTTVTGVLSVFGYENDKPICVINGREYSLSKYALDMYSAKLRGSDVKAVINYLGEVSYITVNDGAGEKWGLLTAVKAPSGPVESEYIFQILTDVGEFVEFKTAKSITVDGRDEKIKSSDSVKMNKFIDMLEEISNDHVKAAGVSENGKNLTQLIQYKLDSDGKINYIDTGFTKEEKRAKRENMAPMDSVYFDDPFTGLSTYANGGIVIGPNYYATSESKTFLYHTDDKSMFGVAPTTKVYPTLLKKAAGIAFYCDNNSIYPAVFMKNNDGSSEFSDMYTNNYAIVKNTTECLDSDGEIALKIYAFVNGVASSFICSPTLAPKNSANITINFTSAKDLNEGDIINLSYNSVTTEFSNFELMYRNNTTFASTSTQQIELGFVYEVKNDGFMYVSGTDASEIENYYANFDLRRTAKADSATITVYDPSQPLNARIRQGTYADLYAYTDLKDAEGDNLPEVTKIFMHTYGAYRRPIDIFVLK